MWSIPLGSALNVAYPKMPLRRGICDFGQHDRIYIYSVSSSANGVESGTVDDMEWFITWSSRSGGSKYSSSVNLTTVEAYLPTCVRFSGCRRRKAKV